MQIKHKFKHLAALALSLSMALLCMPVGAMPENSTTPTDLAPDESVGRTAPPRAKIPTRRARNPRPRRIPGILWPSPSLNTGLSMCPQFAIPGCSVIPS